MNQEEDNLLQQGTCNSHFVKTSTESYVVIVHKQ